MHCSFCELVPIKRYISFFQQVDKKATGSPVHHLLRLLHDVASARSCYYYNLRCCTLLLQLVIGYVLYAGESTGCDVS